MKAIAVLLLCSTLASCATIIHGTDQEIGITSNPSNAYIWVDRNYVGNTPITVKLSRKDQHVVTINLPGYQTYEIHLSRELSGWTFGNIIFGGVIGVAVDAVSGALYRLTPEQVHVEMFAHCKSTNGEDSYIAVVLEPKAEWEKIGNLISIN